MACRHRSSFIILLYSWYFGSLKILYFSYLTIGIWFTLYFAINIAEAIGQSFIYFRVVYKEEDIQLVKKLRVLKPLKYLQRFQQINYVRNLIILELIEVVPKMACIGGKAVNESDITGEAKPIIKSVKNSENKVRERTDVVESDKLNY